MSRPDEQAAMLGQRLRKRERHLRKWARREEVTCYRLYDRDIPEIPLLVDRYEDHLYLALYQRQQARSDGAGARGQRAWLDSMAAAAADALAVPRQRVHIRERRRQRGEAQYRRLARTNEYLEVGEGGHRFLVNLNDYLDTGLFLDHRVTRARVAAEAPGRRFLNLFCYTGAFTVYAAAAGARQTVSIDLSHRYLNWAGRNLAINQLSAPEHQLICADVLEVLRRRRFPAAAAATVGDGFDLAVLDPPTFSNSKKMAGVLDVKRDHRELIAATVALLRPGGILYFSTNARRFQLDTPALSAALAEEGAAPAEIAEITHATTPPDFERRPSHRCWRMVKNAGS
ncbi:MAG: class I SAM-dependent methyltransferase [Myxococcota bacterium]